MNQPIRPERGRPHDRSSRGDPSASSGADSVGGSQGAAVGVPLTGRADLWWLNWTTVRGVALVVAGTVIMVSPADPRLLVAIAGVLFVGWALSEIWFALVRRRATPSADVDPTAAGPTAPVHNVSRLVMAIVLAAAAVLLFLDDLPFTVIIGAVAIVRGLLVASQAVRRGVARRDGFLTAAFLIVVGAVVILVPETAVLALRAGLGVAAMALGGIMLNMGLRRSGDTARLRFDHISSPGLVNDWLMRRRLDPDSRGDLVETLFFEPPNRAAKLASFWVMMVLATGIASFAVIQDSTAVVIGAMLVAPLMTPIMGVSAAAVNGWAIRLIRSGMLVVVAAAAAVFVAWLIASWLPSVGEIATNSQITSRVEPSLLDFCIAVFAGAAGAYATVDPRVSSSLSGVAIAVALVPPLSVVGITLQQGEYQWASGALLLFLTNVVSIVLAALTVFVMMGFAALPPDRDQRARLRRVVGVFGAGALLILVPLSFTSEDLWTEAFDEATAEQVVKAWLPSDGSVEFLSAEAEGESIELELTGPEVPEDTDGLVRGLTSKLGYDPRVKIRLVPSEITELD